MPTSFFNPLVQSIKIDSQVDIIRILLQQFPTDKKGNLRFKTGNSIALPEKGYIGLKANGENTGKETEIDWSGSSLQNIKNGIKGNYNLTVIPKENIIIGGKDYGKVKFVVDIIVE